MIETTLKNVRDAQPAITLLLQGKRIAPKGVYAISKLADACVDEMQRFEKNRTKFFQEAGCTLDEKNSVWVHADGEMKVQEVVKQVDEMLDAKVQINALPLDIEQFGDKAELDGGALFGLEWAMKGG